jgi:hypothetical protein
MSTDTSQESLFAIDPAPPEPGSGVPAGQFDPAAYDAALTGDGYGWLAGLLPAPQSPACGGCGQPMTLPAAAPVVWACLACHPGEAA